MSDFVSTTPQIYVADCELGRGVFAIRRFSRGERILKSTGLTISLSQAIALGEKESNPMQIAEDAYIDIEAPGVFLNHSCAPNAGIVAPGILVALRDIKADEEIRYDYSTTMDENRWTMKCRCGAKICREIVRDFRLLPTEIQQRYLRLGVVQEFIARKANPAP